MLPSLQMVFPETFKPRQEVLNIPIPEYLPKFISNNKLSLGELFLGFLNYYANEFR